MVTEPDYDKAIKKYIDCCNRNINSITNVYFDYANKNKLPIPNLIKDFRRRIKENRNYKEIDINDTLYKFNNVFVIKKALDEFDIQEMKAKIERFLKLYEDEMDKSIQIMNLTEYDLIQKICFTMNTNFTYEDNKEKIYDMVGFFDYSKLNYYELLQIKAFGIDNDHKESIMDFPLRKTIYIDLFTDILITSYYLTSSVIYQWNKKQGTTLSKVNNAFQLIVPLIDLYKFQDFGVASGVEHLYDITINGLIFYSDYSSINQVSMYVVDLALNSISFSYGLQTLVTDFNAGNINSKKTINFMDKLIINIDKIYNQISDKQDYNPNIRMQGLVKIIKNTNFYINCSKLNYLAMKKSSIEFYNMYRNISSFLIIIIDLYYAVGVRGIQMMIIDLGFYIYMKDFSIIKQFTGLGPIYYKLVKNMYIEFDKNDISLIENNLNIMLVYRLKQYKYINLFYNNYGIYKECHQSIKYFLLLIHKYDQNIIDKQEFTRLYFIIQIMYKNYSNEYETFVNYIDSGRNFDDLYINFISHFMKIKYYSENKYRFKSNKRNNKLINNILNLVNNYNSIIQQYKNNESKVNDQNIKITQLTQEIKSQKQFNESRFDEQKLKIKELTQEVKYYKNKIDNIDNNIAKILNKME